jgi:hypothetical protein
MNLKAKRLVRTTCSEQYALFDLDRTDENFEPLSVGKLDVHYTDQGIYGTLLFWAKSCERYAWPELTRLAEALLAEFNSPMGVPAEYAVEFFTPGLDGYELLTNIEADTARPAQPAGSCADSAGDRAMGEEATAPGEMPSGRTEVVREPGASEVSEERIENDNAGEDDASVCTVERLDLHRRAEWHDEV